MSITLVGTAPTTPLTNAQRRAHRALGAAEKRLIHLIVFEAEPSQIEREERTVARLTTAWKRACA